MPTYGPWVQNPDKVVKAAGWRLQFRAVAPPGYGQYNQQSGFNTALDQQQWMTRFIPGVNGGIEPNVPLPYVDSYQFDTLQFSGYYGQSPNIFGPNKVNSFVANQPAPVRTLDSRLAFAMVHVDNAPDSAADGTSAYSGPDEAVPPRADSTAVGIQYEGMPRPLGSWAATMTVTHETYMAPVSGMIQIRRTPASWYAVSGTGVTFSYPGRSALTTGSVIHEAPFDPQPEQLYASGTYQQFASATPNATFTLPASDVTAAINGILCLHVTCDRWVSDTPPYDLNAEYPYAYPKANEFSAWADSVAARIIFERPVRPPRWRYVYDDVTPEPTPTDFAPPLHQFGTGFHGVPLWQTRNRTARQYGLHQTGPL